MNVLILFTCLLYVYRFVSREINPALGFEKDAVHRCSCKEQLINANHPTQQKVPQGQKATKSDVSFEPLMTFGLPTICIKPFLLSFLWPGEALICKY